MNLMSKGICHKSNTDVRSIGFLCGGPPKSGTTLLQHCLDLHPELSCPPEVDLNFIRLSFWEVLKSSMKEMKRSVPEQVIIQI